MSKIIIIIVAVLVITACSSKEPATEQTIEPNAQQTITGSQNVQVSGNDNAVNNGIIINNEAEKKLLKNNQHLSILDDVTIGSNKEYVDSVLGVGKGQGDIAVLTHRDIVTKFK